MSRISDLLEKCESSRSYKFLKFYPNDYYFPIFYSKKIDFEEELRGVLKSVGINPDKSYANHTIPRGPGEIEIEEVLYGIADDVKKLPPIYHGGAEVILFKLRSAKVLFVHYGPDVYLYSDKKDIPELTKAYKDFEAGRFEAYYH